MDYIQYCNLYGLRIYIIHIECSTVYNPYRIKLFYFCFFTHILAGPSNGYWGGIP